MNKFSSMFGQVLQIFSKKEFYSAVKETKSEKGAKGFSCWDQFVAMLFCQLGQAHSLREICGGLASCMGKVKHLGIETAPCRSTLSYANEKRSWRLYEAVFYQLLEKVRMVAPTKKKFRFKNKLFSLDATLIELCVSLFDWATYRQTKGAVKLHLLLDHDGYFPAFAHITDGRTHEVKIAQNLTFPKGSIVVMDRGYVDYALFARWKEEGVWFVSRQKDNANYTVIEERPVPLHRSIVADQLITLNVYYSKQHYPYPLRRIELWDDTKKESIVLLTNHLSFGATTIAAIYKDRWQIEVFFKTIKQNLKIKTFVGTSANALMIQIWTALITILLLKYMMFRSQFGWSLSNLIAMLRYNLFTYRNLWEWIDSPYEVPPIIPYGEQLALEF
ncbi:MAG: Transposase DDE domain protein [Deltaproteobacteria bacterium ADurb.Bin135]|nr:MAG: Transposase DDE domain protein [Deltaproteobacteria bacterium ADurb.Bin135]